MRCPHCGCSNDPGADVCKACGRALATGRCRSCGGAVPAGRDLCFTCHVSAPTAVDDPPPPEERRGLRHGDPEADVATVVMFTDAEDTSKITRNRALTGEEWTFHGVAVPFVGRKAEREALLDAWETVVERKVVRGVVVRGPEGVGKSRLVDDLRRLLEAQGPKPAAVYAGSAARGGSAGDFLGRLVRSRLGVADAGTPDRGREALIQAARDCLPEEEAFNVARLLGVLCRLPLPGSSSFPLAGEVLQGRTWKALARFIAAETRRGAVLLWVDDFDKAGAAEVRALRAVASALEGHPVLIVVSGREAADSPVPGADDFTISVSPLRSADSARLLRALLVRCPAVPPRLKDFVIRRSGGNPRALEGLVRVLVAQGIVRVQEGAWRIDEARLEGGEVPADLDGLLRVRLDGLLSRDRATLEAAALQGDRFEVGGVVACLLADEPPDEDFWLEEHREVRIQQSLDRLVSGDLVRPRPGASSASGLDQRTYRFRDPAARETALGRADPERLVRWHRILAGWLEHRGQDDPGRLAEAAPHWEAGGRRSRAGRCHRAAGDLAAAAFRADEAVACYTRALDQLDDEDLTERLAVREALGRVRHVAGDFLGARAEFRAMLRDTAAARDPRAGARALRRIGATWRDLGDWDRSVRALSRARELFEEEGDLLGVAGCLEDLGKVLLQRGSPHGRNEAHANFELALHLRKEAGDPVGTAKPLHLLGWVLSDFGRFEEARSCYKEAIRIRRTTGDRDGLVRSLNNLGDMYVDAGRHPKGRSYLMQALAECDEIGHGSMRPTVLANLARSYLDTKDLADAARWLERAEQALEGMEARLDQVEVDLLFSRLLQGLGEQAQALERVRHAARLVEDMAGSDQQGQVLRRMAELVSATLYDPEAGDTGARAERYFKRSLEVLQASGNEIEMARTLDAYGRFLVERGRPDPGQEYRRRAARILGRSPEDMR